MSDALLPCPFEETHDLEVWEGGRLGIPDQRRARAYCKQCNIAIPIAAWNRRAPVLSEGEREGLEMIHAMISSMHVEERAEHIPIEQWERETLVDIGLKTIRALLARAGAKA